MPETVLVVDDEASAGRLLQKLVVARGYTCRVAASAEEALRVLAGWPIDALITDVRLPGLDGLELAGRSLLDDPDRPVIVITGYASLHTAIRTVRPGVDGLFTKPFDVSAVGACLERALERRRRVLAERDEIDRLRQGDAIARREREALLQEIEARDDVARRLSGRSPDALQRAVAFCLELAACDAGAVFLQEAPGCWEVAAAVGYGRCDADASRDLLADPAVRRRIDRVFRSASARVSHEPCSARREQGIHSIGLLPIRWDEHVAGVLEIGRSRRDALVDEADLDTVRDYLAYVAVALVSGRATAAGGAVGAVQQGGRLLTTAAGATSEK